MTNHTPGPWRVGRSGCVVCDAVVGSPGRDAPEHVEYYGGHLICESVAASADAALIAAAPELYALLSEILPVLEADLSCADCEQVREEFRDLIARTTAVIAKATSSSSRGSRS